MGGLFQETWVTANDFIWFIVTSGVKIYTAISNKGNFSPVSIFRIFRLTSITLSFSINVLPIKFDIL